MISWSMRSVVSEASSNKGRRDDMPPPRRWQFDPKIAADLHPSADGSAVRTSLVAGGGKLQAASVPVA